MAKQQKMDNEDSLKRRARRRLIGAVALTTAVVVLLPMVLDKEPKPVDQSIELRIPDKNAVAEFNPKMEPVPASAPAVIPEAAEVKPSAPVAAAAPAVPANPVAVSVQGGKDAGPAVSPAKEKPAAAKVKPASAEEKPAKPAAAAKPAAKPQASVKAADETHAAAKSGFIVQVGAYSNAQTAHDLQKKLGQLGIKVFIEKAGDISRVRAGPFKTREEAIKVQSRIAAQGLKPIIAPQM